MIIFRVLLATIRDKGLCPCPRCLVSKSRLDLMGQRRDITSRQKNIREYLSLFVLAAREKIYKKASAIGGAAVNRLLKETSAVPTIVRLVFISDFAWKLTLSKLERFC
jgi:hypothetical protein